MLESRRRIILGVQVVRFPTHLLLDIHGSWATRVQGALMLPVEGMMLQGESWVVAAKGA